MKHDFRVLAPTSMYVTLVLLLKLFLKLHWSDLNWSALYADIAVGYMVTVMVDFHWIAPRLIQSSNRKVCGGRCLSSRHAIYFEISHWPWDHMISSQASHWSLETDTLSMFVFTMALTLVGPWSLCHPVGT